VKGQSVKIERCWWSYRGNVKIGAKMVILGSKMSFAREPFEGCDYTAHPPNVPNCSLLTAANR
jgi:hypothetical protein